MDQNPELGILQQLTVGLPATSPFARLFQVGMRHGMRTYTLGSAWWQGDCGPFWGHNGIVRIAPFRAHCRLPELPGSPPFGGRILSHDQVEAVLMRRAGREVRVLPLEDGSYEAHPPTVVEFVNRDRRWAQGNLQYLNLIPRLGEHPPHRPAPARARGADVPEPAALARLRGPRLRPRGRARPRAGGGGAAPGSRRAPWAPSLRPSPGCSWPSCSA
jgi:membrane glycosyltransferase